MSTTGEVNNNSSATGMFTNAAGGKGGTLDKDSFLLLLVTQFRHQDPLNPMEDKEFIAQLAQFSSLEQQMNTNETMQKLVDIQNEQKLMGAASYIGKEVTAKGFGVSVTANGISELKYASAEAVTKGYINIYDANRLLVDTITLGATAPGINILNWDGILPNGNKAANGVYTVNIAGEDAAGQPIMFDTSVSGRVDGVSLYDGQQLLRMEDGRIVALANVREIIETKKATAPEEPKDPETPKDPEDTEDTDDETGGTGGTDGETGGETGGTGGETGGTGGETGGTGGTGGETGGTGGTGGETGGTGGETGGTGGETGGTGGETAAAA